MLVTTTRTDRDWETNAQWTVIFEDRKVINQNVKTDDGHAIGHVVGDDAFWNDSKWSNIWAIQYKDDDHDYNDTVEYRDETPHATWTAANLGDFRAQFVDKWDTAHLAYLQAIWDGNSDPESEKGPRPTSYSSY